jgi:hypothetical protein
MATSRELSARVEIDVHLRPNKFRRRTWWGAVFLSVLCLAWLAFEGARGEYQIFEGGDLATPHRLFENDCAKCHVSWATVDRVFAMDMSDTVYSVKNDACLACHPGSPHHDNQTPGHSDLDLSCAQCHVEHIGDHDLKRVADQTCVNCHEDLKTRSGFTHQFNAQITAFDDPEGHPEFAFRRLIDSKQKQFDAIGPDHKVRNLLSYIEQDPKGKPFGTWGDKANIRFNHAKHLQVSEDGRGNKVYGLIAVRPDDHQDRFMDLSQTCTKCHVKDDEGKYMQPINYENHCQQCHPLLFDNDRFKCQTVPHETPLIVRGFLTEKYTLAALRGSREFQLARPSRGIPGRRQGGNLTEATAKELKNQVEIAEHLAIRHEHSIFGKEAKGGCAYCHTMKDESLLGEWGIVPTNIPDRWQPHARFSHVSHQMMKCVECHGDVDKSELTADVLLPSISSCRKCHSRDPEPAADDAIPRRFGARTDCAECHIYHDHEKDNFVGWFNSQLERVEPKPNESQEDKSSK